MNKFIQFTFFIILSNISLSSDRPNIVLILSDDHRHDFMGFHEESPEWLETPNMDFLASKGAHLKKCFRFNIFMLFQAGLVF